MWQQTCTLAIVYGAVLGGALHVLGPGFEESEERRKQQTLKKQEQAKNRILGDYNEGKWYLQRDKDYRATEVELTPGKTCNIHK